MCAAALGKQLGQGCPRSAAAGLGNYPDRSRASDLALAMDLTTVACLEQLEAVAAEVVALHDGIVAGSRHAGAA